MGKEGGESGEEGTSPEKICLYVLFVVVVLILSTLTGYWMRKNKSRFIQEASAITFIGILAGILLKVFGHKGDLYIMEGGFPTVFFLVLLPPIIFESAYNTNKKVFFSNFGSILTYAFLGTFIAAIVTTILIYSLGYYGYCPEFTIFEAAAYGSLISATDPVSVIAVFKEIKADETLFSVIFGESIFNDAVTIVLYQTIVQSMNITSASPLTNIFLSIASFVMIFLGSFAIGGGVAFLTTYILKYFHPVITQPDEKGANRTQMSIMIISPVLAYLISQGFEFSGIVSILCCGFILSQYAAENLTMQTRKVLKILYQASAYCCESSVFLFLGMSLVEFYVAYAKAGWTLLILNIVFVLVARYINIGSCSILVNLGRKRQPIGGKFQFLIWYSGLRGTIAYILALQCAQVFKEGNGDVIVLNTLIYALFTLFIQSSFLNAILDYCDVKAKPQLERVSERPKIQEQGCCEDLKHALAHFDFHYLKKYFILEHPEPVHSHPDQSATEMKESQFKLKEEEEA